MAETKNTRKKLPAISELSEELLDGMVYVRGAAQNNLKNLDLKIPRDKFVVFTGVSGSGKSSLAFGTIYAESQRRFFESLAPYARRLIAQLPAPEVNEILGLPPAVALEQRRAEPGQRSSVGTITTLSNILRMLFSRAGTYPEKMQKRLDSDAFSANTASGACPDCHGVGSKHSVSEKSLVPDPELSIRQQAIAAWPGAWQGKNLRDILAVLGYDIDKPWKKLSRKERDWILFTDEKPVVTVYAEREAHRIQRPYQGTYMSAASYVMHTYANSKSPSLRKRAARFIEFSRCGSCNGKRLRAESLSVKFGGYDIAELSALPLDSLSLILQKHLPESADSAAAVLVKDLLDRIDAIRRLGLDYLSLDRSVPTLSSGELQRLRLATQLRSGLFGVIYVLDEPSAGLHPADSESLFDCLMQLLESGNSLFVVEHEMTLVKKADWIVDIGPGAGQEGGQLLYSGPLAGLSQVSESKTREYLFGNQKQKCTELKKRITANSAWLKLAGVNRHNLKDLSVQFPLAAMTVVSGVSGAGKSTLVSKVLFELMQAKLSASESCLNEEGDDGEAGEAFDCAAASAEEDLNKAEIDGFEAIDRMILVDQKPIGRSPRSNLATYTGLFDQIRQAFAATSQAKSRGYKAGRFSFNVDGGRCNHCQGEGFVSVELLFLPTVYSPCPRCKGSRYNLETLAIEYKGLNISQVLDLTVKEAAEFFKDSGSLDNSFKTLLKVGLAYLRLGQPATELSGGEAQRIKLASELQRNRKGRTLYILDEPTNGLHPADVEHLEALLQELVDNGNTVIVVEHDLDLIARADWVIDLGPGAGAKGGSLVAACSPAELMECKESLTGRYLKDRQLLQGKA